MERTELKTKLNQIFCRVFSDDKIKIHERMTANDISGWDSLAHINLIIAIEKSFQIRFNTAETGSLENVGSLINTIESHLKDV